MDEDIEARLEALSPTLRPLARAMIVRIDLATDHRVPADVLVSAALSAEFAEVVKQLHADPALHQEWVEFWLAYAAAYAAQDDE